MNYFEVVSLLDIEGDEYEIVPYGAEFNYSVVKGLSGEEADRAAQEYIKNHVTYPVQNIERRRITVPDGKTIGYEYRPLQNAFMSGESDVLDIYYVLESDGTPLEIETWDLHPGYGSSTAIAFSIRGSSLYVSAGESYHIEVPSLSISYDVQIVDCDI